jgi:hypothetical protein
MIKLFYKPVSVLVSVLGGVLAAATQGAIYALVKAVVGRGRGHPQAHRF